MSSYRHHFPAMVPYLFHFGWTIDLTRTKSFVFSVQSVVKHMQNIGTSSVISNDFAQCHSAVHCKFVSGPLGTGPRSLPEFLDNPAFFCRTHSGFWRDRRSNNFREDNSLDKTREAQP